ncbi:sensor domain-containing protein [Senegalia sp. (in: firmicutes)]|uniref:sensor domain-containing protein n=2 Tax=Senegalia sp. (in: firmicutes) TaxID=1924098 RepID=UPI003F9E2D3A
MGGISFKDVKNIIRKCLIAIIPITIIFILLINHTESKAMQKIKGYIVNNSNALKDNIIFGMNQNQMLTLLFINILLIFLTIIRYIYIKNKSELGIAENVAKNTNDAVIITDRYNNITYVNESYEKITGYSKEEVMGHTPGNFKSGKHKKEFYKDMWKSINKKGYFRSELWDKRKDGVLYPKDLSIYKINNKLDKKDFKYIGIFTDLTDIKRDQEFIDKLKDYNIDTDLPNENLLFKLINNSISKKQEKFFVVYLSIENYNTIVLNSNENLEYNLKIFIRRINTILDDKNFIAHISKSKFVIGLSSFDSKDKVENFMKKLIDVSKLSYFIRDNELYFDIKAGVCNYPDDGKYVNELLVNSNIALDKAIGTKGKYYLYFDESFKEDIQKEQEIKMMLNKAIIYDEFSINYQPQIDSRNNQIVGAEALLRWNTKKYGFISPAIFIPIAEKTGQIVEIGYWVIDRVFNEYMIFKENINENFRICINISPMQFNDENFIKRIKESIIKNNIDTNYFELEITENLLLDDLTKVNKKLKELKDLGFTIAIDDFGTGYSSLSYIKQLHIDKLKIDRAFIKDYPEKDNGEIADIITIMSRTLRLEVIAEGVETKEQVDYLRSKGCHLIQGYFYSKPIPPSDFVKYLKG